MIILPMTASLWGPTALGFVKTAGVSATIAAKDLIATLLSNPGLLLYNQNVQNYPLIRLKTLPLKPLKVETDRMR